MKKILITGGAGFIGSYLCEKLYDLGYEIILLDNLSQQIHPNYEGSFLQKKVAGKAQLIKGDVANKDDWRKALEGVEAVVHLAAETGTGQSMYEIERYYKVNVLGTSLLLDILVNETHSVKKIVIASSRAIYGEGKYKDADGMIHFPLERREEEMSKKIFEPINTSTGELLQMVSTDEDAMLHPSSIYGLTKLAQEQMIMLMGKQLKIPSVALRFQNVYGPGQSLSNPYTGLLAVFSNRIRGNKPLDIYEDGRETRDFVYIDDVVESIILSLTKAKADDEVFNIGSGVATPILKVAELMCRFFKQDVPITISGNYRIGDIRHNCADIAKAQKLLGFQPKISFEEGLAKFVEWVNVQEMVEDKYDASVAEIKAKGLMK